MAVRSRCPNSLYHFMPQAETLPSLEKLRRRLGSFTPNRKDCGNQFLVPSTRGRVNFQSPRLEPQYVFTLGCFSLLLEQSTPTPVLSLLSGLVLSTSTRCALWVGVTVSVTRTTQESGDRESRPQGPNRDLGEQGRRILSDFPWGAVNHVILR